MQSVACKSNGLPTKCLKFACILAHLAEACYEAIGTRSTAILVLGQIHLMSEGPR